MTALGCGGNKGGTVGGGMCMFGAPRAIVADLGLSRVATMRGLQVVGTDTSGLRMEVRRSIWVRAVSLRDCGKLPVSNVASAPAAAMMQSAGVTSGLEMYLCLWNTVADTRKERVFVIHIVQAQ